MTTGKTLSAALLLTFCMVATSAMAAPITSWDYDISYSFSDWNNKGEMNFWGEGLKASDGNTKLSWGNWWKEKSSISVKGKSTTSPGTSSGTYDSNNDVPEEVMTLTHNNRPIYGSSNVLKWATLTSSLTLEAGGAPIDSEMPWVKNFNIKFWETPNNEGRFTGFWSFLNTGDVDDIFYLENSVDLVNTFEIGNYLYTLTFTIEDLGELKLTDTEKYNLGIEKGADGEFYGLRTSENGKSEFKSKFSITSEELNTISSDNNPSPTPEPGTMILFGMGMIGMAGAIRRKKTA